MYKKVILLMFSLLEWDHSSVIRWSAPCEEKEHTAAERSCKLHVDCMYSVEINIFEGMDGGSRLVRESEDLTMH